jgi:hypothetical protein
MSNYEKVKAWRKANPEKRAAQQSREGKKDYSHNKHLRATYGITRDDYNRMFMEQEGKCAICAVHQTDLKRRLCVDHNHTTSVVRALLCHHCNTMVGMAKEDTTILQNAITYLNRHTGY